MVETKNESADERKGPKEDETMHKHALTFNHCSVTSDADLNCVSQISCCSSLKPVKRKSQLITRNSYCTHFQLLRFSACHEAEMRVK